MGFVCQWYITRLFLVALSAFGIYFWFSFPFLNLTGSLIRDIRWGEVNFIHTTDTHGWYSGHLNQKQYHANWGDFISFTTRLKEIANYKDVDLLLIDTGDRHDGNGLTDVTEPNGKMALPIFIKQDYDLATIGNHELYLWENSKQEADVVVAHYGTNYVCSNVEYISKNGTLVPFGQKYKYFVTPKKGYKVLAFSFLFNFNRNNDKTKVYPIEEIIHEHTWFQETIKAHPPEAVDVLIIFGHIPITHEWKELYNLHLFLRKFYPNTIIQYFGGHSHIRDFTVFDGNLSGLQSGRFCETVGWASVNVDVASDDVTEKFFRSYIDFNLNSFMHHSKANNLESFHTEEGQNVSRLIKETRKKLQLHKVIGYVAENYYLDYVPVSHPKSIFLLLTSQILPTLPQNGSTNERIIIINTGSIRYDMYKGPYTIDSQYIVSPFENLWVKLSVPKRIALKISHILNKQGYIFPSEYPDSSDCNPLLPVHQYFMRLEESSITKRQEHFTYPNLKLSRLDRVKLHSGSGRKKLPKGYVTCDDFGCDGDDTAHKPVVNFPIPSVVQATQVSDSVPDGNKIDVIFYNFIEPNVRWALKQLKYNATDEVTQYSDKYLGLLLNEYVRTTT